MKNRCILSPTALGDLNDIPNIGKSYEFLRSGIRGIPLEGYIIFYRVIEIDIIILRVVSGRQNFTNLFDDEN